ncbi:MAG: HNH endonuclease [Candidatus Moranbacteria bacterium]|nr:HNH endonuclease [Candidatus Moranbacteria bacterium]
MDKNILIIGVVISVIITFLIDLISGFIALLVSYQIYIELYFRGDKFKKIKNSIQEYTKNCNELNHHIQQLKSSYVNVKSYDYGESNMQDDSNYSFKRKEWNKDIKNNQVHNCSAIVCKNASNQPFKYLCKYFDIKVNEETLSNFENVLNDFEAAEQGKILLQKERDLVLNNIKNSISPLIYFFSKKKLTKKLGFEDVDLSNLHFPAYTFQYVSAGGNSSTKCDIKLDLINLNKFISYLNEVVKFRKSIAGQRALMTSNLREKIKVRDEYTCQKCSLSTNDERNLLLEIDHITPLSKGGITMEDNLQVLCWRCNRTKGSKIENI